jgi:RHS repeat-associated protein
MERAVMGAVVFARDIASGEVQPSMRAHLQSMNPRAASRLWRSTVVAMILVLLLAIGTQAFAQESGRSWTVGTLGTFKTQREAEQAIQALGSDWAQVRVIKSQTIAESEISVTYWMGVAPSAIQNWTYRDLPPGGNYTEEDQRASYIAYYNRRSVADGCVPNTTAQRTAPWIVLRTWGDGVSWSELGRYDITFIAKRSFPPSGCMTLTAQENPARNRTRCANPLMVWDDTKRICENNLFATMTSTPLLCDRCGLVGNPSDVTTGNKYQPEPDLDLGWVAFSRYYQSGVTNIGGGFGYGWTHSHNVRIAIGVDYGTGPDIGLIQADGAQIPFKRINVDLYEDTTGSGDRLTKSGSVWTLNQQQRQLEFDNNGLLTAVRNEDGTSLAYLYNTLSQLMTITHNTGRQLEFSYDPSAPVGDSRVLSVAVSGVAQMTYAYTAAGMLDTVTYADAKQRKYHYEDPRFPSNLTGITDENSRRYSTFAYDAQGRVVSSMHAGGVESTQLVYSASGGAQVTDANGLTTQYALASGADGKPRKVASVTRPASGNRPASSIDRTYNNATLDFRRRLNRYVDRNGHVTTYDYQTLTDAVTQREVTRYISKEAFGTTIERLSQTDRDAASNRMVMRQVGNQASRVTRNARLQPVALIAKDLDDGATRTTTMSYCEQGDVTAGICPIVGLLTAIDGPRTDVVDVVSHSYRMADESSCIAAPMTCPYRKGDLWKIVNAKNQTTEVLAYDSVGRAKSIKDVNGVITDVEYSPRGWLTASKVRGTNDASEADDRITRIEYDPAGTVHRVVLPDGVYTQFGYDTALRLTSVIDPAGNRMTYTLNAAGERIKEDTQDTSGALLRTLSRTYDTLGRLQTLTDADLRATTFSYDGNGQLTLTTDALGRKTANAYDALGRLKASLHDVDGVAASTQFQYDALDRPTGVIDPKGLLTATTYSGFGDPLTLRSPDTGLATSTFDEAGNLKTRTDARGITVTYGYDLLNRVTTVSYPDSSRNLVFEYDQSSTECYVGERFGKGRVTMMTDSSGSTAYCYDRYGQLSRKLQLTQGRTYVLRYLHTDPRGRVPGQDYLLQNPPPGNQFIGMIHPDGSSVRIVRDAQSRPVELKVTLATGQTKTLLSGATYYPFGPVNRWTYGNGRILRRSLNQNYQPGFIEDTAPGGISEGYWFDAVGNLESLRKADQADPARKTYGYDGLNRLTQVRDGASNAVLQAYAYDKTGNRTSKQNAGATTAYSYTANSHLLSSVGTVTRVYDTVGNTTRIGAGSASGGGSGGGDSPVEPMPGPGDPGPGNPNPPPETEATGGTSAATAFDATSVVREFIYDDANRMRQVKHDGAVAMHYLYNGKGEQVYKTGSDKTITTVYDESGRWIGDYDANGQPIQQAIWLDDLPVGLLVGAGVNQKLYYIEADALGTPRVIIDPDRNVAVWRWDLAGEAFGDSAQSEDVDGDGTALVFDMRMPGQRWDNATGMSYNYFRDYDPSTGRYSQSDPIGLDGGISTYGYVGGNPLTFTDPEGLNGRRGVPVRPMTTVEAVAQVQVPYLVRQIQQYEPTFRYQTIGPRGYRYNNQDTSFLQGILRQHQANQGQSCPAPITYGRTPGGIPLSRHYSTERVDRNIPVSLIDSIVNTTRGTPNRGAISHYDRVNDVTVVIGNNGVITSHRGE